MFQGGRGIPVVRPNGTGPSKERGNLPALYPVQRRRGRDLFLLTVEGGSWTGAPPLLWPDLLWGPFNCLCRGRVPFGRGDPVQVVQDGFQKISVGWRCFRSAPSSGSGFRYLVADWLVVRCVKQGDGVLLDVLHVHEAEVTGVGSTRRHGRVHNLAIRAVGRAVQDVGRELPDVLVGVPRNSGSVKRREWGQVGEINGLLAAEGAAAAAEGLPVNVVVMAAVAVQGDDDWGTGELCPALPSPAPLVS